MQHAVILEVSGSGSVFPVRDVDLQSPECTGDEGRGGSRRSGGLVGVKGVRTHRDEVGCGFGGQVQRMGEFLPVHEVETSHGTVQPFQFLRVESQQTERFAQLHEMIPARGHHHESPAWGEHPGELCRVAGREHAEHGIQASRSNG